MDPSRPDVVFDCNVLVQAVARANGPAAVALRLIEHNAITLYVSRPILRELRRTLAYPELQERNPHVTEDVIKAFVARMLFRGTLIRDVPRVFEFPRDVHDEPYLDLAAAVSADYLVTRDRDLLSVATDHSIDGKQFRQRFPHLSVLDPVAFLNELRKTMPEAVRSVEEGGR